MGDRERRSQLVQSQCRGRTHALHASSPGSLPGLGEYYSRCKNLALYIRDCESLCLSDETVKAVGPFYLVAMPGPGK